ncbi:MAG TPA: hypothetical protein DEB39_04995, partial [Planctomycetaceae bacterium]|nr:hypothetical protein [Planctomycetaceae bacterium]
MLAEHYKEVRSCFLSQYGLHGAGDEKMNDVKERIVYQMKTMNGITNELKGKKARRNWQTRCGGFLLGVVAAWSAAYDNPALAVVTSGTVGNEQVVTPISGTNNYSLDQLGQRTTVTDTANFFGGTVGINNHFDSVRGITNFYGGSGDATIAGGEIWLVAGEDEGEGSLNIKSGAVLNIGSRTAAGGMTDIVGGTVNVESGGRLNIYSEDAGTKLNIYGTGLVEVNGSSLFWTQLTLNGGTLRLTGGSKDDTLGFMGIKGTGGTIDTNGYDLTIDGGFDTGFDLVKAGGGTLYISTLVTIGNDTGTRTIDEGTLRFQTENNLGTGRIIFTGSSSKNATLYKDVETFANTSDFLNDITVSGLNSVGTFFIASTAEATDYTGRGADSLHYLGNLTGEGMFVKSGGATMYLGAFDNGVWDTATVKNSQFMGDFKVDGGTVVAGDAEGIGMNSGSYDLVIGKGMYVADYNGTLSRNVILTNADDNGTLYGIGLGMGRSLAVAGIVSGTGNLVKHGEGALFLVNENNSYRGRTVIDDGILSVASGDHLGDTSALHIGVSNDASKIPVFRTTADATIRPDIVLNNANSTILISNGNTTTATGNISGNGNLHLTTTDATGTDATLHLKGNGEALVGEFYIDSGTLMIDNAVNVNRKTIHLGDATGSSPNTNAALRVGNGNNVALTNAIELAPNATVPGGIAVNTLMVDAGSALTLSGPIHNAGYGSGGTQPADLYKRGAGTLTLAPASANTFTGTMFLDEGTLIAGKANVLQNANGLTMKARTYFDMSAGGGSQTIKNLTAAQGASAADKARINIGANTLTLNSTNNRSEFHGIVYGNGTIVKTGGDSTVQSLGFYLSDAIMFNGNIDVQAGTLAANTDVYATSLTGNAGTFFDIADNTFTITTNGDAAYGGTFVSSVTTPAGSGTFVKAGSGTFTTAFTGASGANAFNGSVKIQQGNLNIKGDWTMLGGEDNTLTFTIDNLVGAAPSVIDVQGTNGRKGTVTIGGGDADDDSSTVALKVDIKDGASWQLKAGEHTVGLIQGSAASDYTNLVADNTTGSLFYGIGKREDVGSDYKNLLVVADVTGIGGVADSHNAREAGNNLDGIRSGTAVPDGLGELIQSIWAYGGTDIRESNRSTKIANINAMLTSLSGDTMANAMYIGLNRPWRTPFDRLNL